MEEDRSHMTKRILNLTLEIIYLLTGEDYEVVNKTSGKILTPGSPHHSPSPIIVPPPHFHTSKKNKENMVLEVIYKMIELLTGEVPIRCQDVTVCFSMEERQYLEGHTFLYKDTMMEKQPPSTSPDESSNRNPPERCTGPLPSWDCTQEVPSTPLHYQGKEQISVKAEVKEEDEMYVRGDQQSMEEGDMMRTIQEEEETHVRSDQQSTEASCMMRTIKEEEEESYVRNDQQSMEEGDLMRTSKEEEGTYVRGDQQSMEEGGMLRTIKKEEEETCVRNAQQSMEGDTMRTSKEEEEETYVTVDQQFMVDAEMRDTMREEFHTASNEDGWEARINSEGRLISPPDDNAEDNGTTQYSAGGTPITGNTHHRLHHEDRSLHPTNLEESSASNFSGAMLGVEKTFPCSECKNCYSEESQLIVHQSLHRGECHLFCPECGIYLPEAGSLRELQSGHTGEHLFSCSECGKHFSVKSSILAQQQIHREKSLLSCSACGKGSIEEESLLRHQRRHKGKNPLSCSECGKYFHKKGTLRKCYVQNPKSGHYGLSPVKTRSGRLIRPVCRM
ncbi:gastrula zinc finger protein XlCGF53.1-like [Hyperolius riggenbachi]|uniref:gastrula zinc finger protein XlCGF53.1-like n=1 Tax=Hyperolius riggenbachi TaxID=752182 RepID=UPI0035A32565